MEATPVNTPAVLSTEKMGEVVAVYGSALLQGVALILFPAAGSLFTEPAFHGLSDAQFGVLFTPQIIGAIVMSLSAARLARRFGMKRVLLGGMGANVLAMALLALSHWLIGAGSLTFFGLLLATASVGAGFGLTITALNAYAFDLFRAKADAAVTGLHVLAGLGQASASLILNGFRDYGVWWGAPVSVGAALLLMMGLQLCLALRLASEGRTEVDKAAPREGQQAGLPSRIGLYALVVLLYGACEATFGNWSTIYLEQDAGLAATEAALALAVFWGMVTLGRGLFTLAAIWFRPQRVYPIAPFVVGAAFVGLPMVTGFVPSMLVLAVAGLALSFFFPLSVSLASAEEPDRAAAVSGALVGAIMLGTGISSLLVGQATAGLGLALIFQWSSGYALLMGGLVVYLLVGQRRG